MGISNLNSRFESPQVHHKDIIKIEVPNLAKRANFGTFCVNLRDF